MVTYRFCLARLSVRIWPPHPVLLFALFCFLSVPAFAVDSGAPDSEQTYSISPDVSLADVVPNQDIISTYAGDPQLDTLFNNRFYGSHYYRLVTRWNNYRPTTEEGQHLAYEVLDLATGIDRAISAVAGDVVVELDKWVNTQPVADTVNGRLIYSWTVPNLLTVLGNNIANSFYSSTNRYWGAWTISSASSSKNLFSGDLLALITQNQGSTHDMLNNSIHNQGWNAFYIKGEQLYKNMTVGDLLALISHNQAVTPETLRSLLSETGSVTALIGSGQTEQVDSPTLTWISRNGFAGLASLLGGDERVIHMNTVDPNDPLNTNAGFVEMPSLFDFLGYYSELSLRELSKLSFVLASEDDIVLKQEEKPNEDAVKDHFFGDGDGAVSPSDISDAAGITSGMKDTFGGAGSPGDVFVVAGSQETYSFFSEAVGHDLDAVNSPAEYSLDDDWLLDLPQDENGFYYNEFISPEDYLKGR